MASHEDAVAYGATFEALCDAHDNKWPDSTDLVEDPYASFHIGELYRNLRDRGYIHEEIMAFMGRAVAEYRAMQEDLEQGVSKL
jgi:hypothetical protein